MQSGLERGLVQVYTGDGKGKTTAALGQAIRAAGQGLKVYLVQFLKPAGQFSGELQSLPPIGIKITRHREGFSLRLPQSQAEQEKFKVTLHKMLEEVKQAFGEYDVIILDEINCLLEHRLIEEGRVLDLINSRPEGVELILTGRNAPASICQAADLVTEMKLIKHPYQKGIKARKGIEY